QFQRDEVPENVETVTVHLNDVVSKTSDRAPDGYYDADCPPKKRDDFVGVWRPFIKLDKMLAKAGLADSVTDGLRKIKEHAVQLNNQTVACPLIAKQVPADIILRVGKRMKKVSIVVP